MRRSPRRPAFAPLRAALPLLAVLAAACASDGPSGPRSPEPFDVGALLAEAAVPSVGGMTSILVGTPAVVVPSVARGAACAYDSAARGFVCPTTTAGGLTVATSYTLLDAAGNPQTQPDRATTAAIRVVSTAEGTVTVPTGAAVPVGGTGVSSGPLAVSRRQDLTLSGLLADRHTLDGTATTTVAGTVTVSGFSVPVRSTVTETVAGLVLPATGAGASPWPRAGTVTLDATTSAAPLPPTTTRLRLAFDGTGTIGVTITTDGRTQSCTLTPGGATTQLSCAP